MLDTDDNGVDMMMMILMGMIQILMRMLAEVMMV